MAARGQKRRKKATAKKPVAKTLTFYLDSEVVDAFNEANMEESRARAALKSWQGLGQEDPERDARLQAALDEAVEKLATAKATMEEERFEIRLRSIPRDDYFDLLALHPPTEEQNEELMRVSDEAGLTADYTEAQRRQIRLQANPDTWPRALVAACADPPLDEDELESIFGKGSPWAQEDIQEMFNTAELVCTRASILKR